MKNILSLMSLVFLYRVNATYLFKPTLDVKTQGKIDLRNESGRPMKVKVVGEVSEK